MGFIIFKVNALFRKLSENYSTTHCEDVTEDTHQQQQTKETEYDDDYYNQPDGKFLFLFCHFNNKTDLI